MHLRDLEDRFDGNREDKRALERQIVQVSLEASVLCRFTAFVAVDHEVVNEGGRLVPVTQPVGTAAGWESLASNETARAAAAPAPARARMAMPTRRPAPPTSAPAFDDSDDDCGKEAPPAERAGPAPFGGSAARFDVSHGEDAFAAPPPAVVRSAALAPPSAPPPSSTSGILGGLARVVGQVFGDGPARDEADASPSDRPSPKKEASTPSSPGSSGLAFFAARIAALIERLVAGEPLDDVADELRLLIEGAALAGGPPAARKPLVDALAALDAGHGDKALALLRPHGDAAAARGED